MVHYTLNAHYSVNSPVSTHNPTNNIKPSNVGHINYGYRVGSDISVVEV